MPTRASVLMIAMLMLVMTVITNSVHVPKLQSIQSIYFVLLSCCLWQWHIIDFVMHTYRASCGRVSAAVVDIFKHCGKDIQKTFKSDINERVVSKDKIKKWLTEIKQHARSKLLVSCHSVVSSVF